MSDDPMFAQRFVRAYLLALGGSQAFVFAAVAAWWVVG